MFSQSNTRTTNFKFGTCETTIRNLLRFTDFSKWYFSLVRRSPNCINRHEIIKTEMELTTCLKNLKSKTFREYCIVSIDVKSIHIDQKSYAEYKPNQSFFKNPEFPTHSDYSKPIPRWITLGTIYDDNIIIDAGNLSRKMLNLLLEFLHERSTIVVAYNFPELAWLLHLGFGHPRFSYSEYQTFSGKEQEAYQMMGVMKNLRVFDLKSVVNAVTVNHPGYNIKDWDSIGIEPEGESLWHLSQAIIGIDLVGNDANNVENLNIYWAVNSLNNVQAKLLETRMN